MIGNGHMLLAIPSMGEGGLDAERSGHFGRCDRFTLVEIDAGRVAGVRVLDNPPHEEGGCLRPVALLAGEGVDAIAVAGIGPRPLAGFNEAGIAVYHDDKLPLVGQVVESMLAGEVAIIDASATCGHHHH